MRSMIRAFFLDVRDGRLKRLAYLGYSLLLIVIGLGVALTVVTLVSGAETVFSGDLGKAEKGLDAVFDGPLLLPLSCFLALLLFADLNLAAKRLRDIGLPGWSSVLALAAGTIVAYLLLSEPGGDVFSLVAWIALILTPSNLFNRR